MPNRRSRTAGLVAFAIGWVVLVPAAASAAGFTGGLAPTIHGGLADMNGSGGVGGRDDSNGFYGFTHIIDGALDCGAWATPNAGTLGDATIDASDDCTLVGVDGTPDGATIVVENGHFVSVDGAPIADGYRMPAIFNVGDPTDESLAEADMGWWVFDGRVDVNLNGQIDDSDCARGVVGEVDDVGLGPPSDGADVLGAAPACGNASPLSPAFDGRVDLDSDGTISSADTCTNGCFVGLDVVAGFVGGSDPGTSPTITSFSPGSGPVGTTVTITGTNLANATEIRFNGVIAHIVSNTDTTIVTRVPNGATTGTIAVSTPAGDATSDAVFTVGTEPPPPPGGGHPRAVTLELRRTLVASGIVSSLDGAVECAERALVKVQRRVGRRWTTIQSARTNGVGLYRATLPNFPGRYRAFIPNAVLPSGERCRLAMSPVVTRT